MKHGDEDVYLDHNATSPLRAEALDAMTALLREPLGNPSSVHARGVRARALLDEARATIAQALGVAPDEIVFTSGGTESNHLALLGAARALARRGRSLLVSTSAVEHPSVAAAAARLAREGHTVRVVPPDSDGRVDPERFARSLEGDATPIASLQWANHETGILQPVLEAAEATAARDGVFHSDAVQALGKVALPLDRVPVHLLSITAHKIGGPVGIGALVVRHGTALEPLLEGGKQEHELRSGTTPVVLAVGFAAALRAAVSEQETRRRRLASLRDRLKAGILRRVEDARVFGREDGLANTLLVGFRDADREALLVALDLEGFQVSAGAACASGTTQTSPVLRAMGVPDEWARCALRFSLGPGNEEDQIDRLLERLPALVRRARGG